MLHSRLSCLSQEIWDATVGRVLACDKELRNAIGRYAVAVKKDGMVIGHLPSCMFAHFFLLTWLQGSQKSHLEKLLATIV